jgi:hypothetical protein
MQSIGQRLGLLDLVIASAEQLAACRSGRAAWQSDQCPFGTLIGGLPAMIYPEPAKVGRGQKSKIILPFSRVSLQQARAVRQCSAGANYGRGNWREIARGADIKAAPPLGPGLADCPFARRCGLRLPGPISQLARRAHTGLLTVLLIGWLAIR